MADVYYIREQDAEEALGPFPLEHLQSWGEIGRISPDTLYYDDELEAWARIEANDRLKEKIFPARKRLSLRPAPAPDAARKRTLVEEDEAADEPEAETVDTLLAAAEGDTEETRFVREQERWRNRTAAITCPTLAAIMLFSAVSYIYPSWETIEQVLNEEVDYLTALSNQPLIAVGILDLFFALAMALGATQVFPLMQLRAMMGAGFFATI